MLSPSRLQALAVWLTVQFAPLKRLQDWTEMGVGIREREKASICAPAAACGSGTVPKLRALFCWGTATDEGQIKTWADGLIY